MMKMTDPFKYVRQAVQAMLKIDPQFRPGCIDMMLKVLEQSAQEEANAKMASVVTESADSLHETTSPPAQDVPPGNNIPVAELPRTAVV